MLTRKNAPKPKGLRGMATVSNVATVAPLTTAPVGLTTTLMRMSASVFAAGTAKRIERAGIED